MILQLVDPAELQDAETWFTTSPMVSGLVCALILFLGLLLVP